MSNMHTGADSTTYHFYSPTDSDTSDERQLRSPVLHSALMAPDIGR
jgi:hypothetical protein